MSISVTSGITATRPVAGFGPVTAGALARLVSIAALAIILWPGIFESFGFGAVHLPVLTASGVMIATGALVARNGRGDRPGLRLVLLTVNALSAWAVPAVLVLNLVLVYVAVTEPGVLCHDLPCREGVALTVLLGVSALASIADALLSPVGAVRMCRGLPGGTWRRAGWSMLACGVLLAATSVALYAANW